VLDLDASFHAERSPGELIERIDGDVSAIADFFARFVVQVLGSGVFLLGVLALLFREDWRVGALLSLFALAALAFMTRGGGFVAVRAGAARQAAADLSGYLEERLAGLPDLKTSGADAYAMRRLHERLTARFHRARASAMAGSIFNGVVGLLFALGTGAALGLSTALHGAGAVTLGTVYLVFRYTGMLRQPLQRLSRQMNSFQQATGGIVRVRELLATRARVVDGRGATLPTGPLSVELDGVSFAYQAEPVLRGVSCLVEPGEVLGLLGRTGSGKTTISRLLFRLHDPNEGTVRLGGVDLRQARLDALRTRIGLVTQDVQLFQATLRDNVALFDPSVPDPRLREVFTELGLDEWLRALPAGLDTPLGAGGRGLSAGEAQLVALARVFLKDPGLVVLDEASSRLDPATERLLEGALTRLLDGRTGVVIAHRLATVERADRVLEENSANGPTWRATPRRASPDCSAPAWRRCWHEPAGGAPAPGALQPGLLRALRPLRRLDLPMRADPARPGDQCLLRRPRRPARRPQRLERDRAAGRRPGRRGARRSGAEEPVELGAAEEPHAAAAEPVCRHPPCRP
jgi:ATP-binding cassette, subfamily B, bacterial